VLAAVVSVALVVAVGLTRPSTDAGERCAAPTGVALGGAGEREDRSTPEPVHAESQQRLYAVGALMGLADQRPARVG
jgi:hypothetical protein